MMANGLILYVGSIQFSFESNYCKTVLALVLNGNDAFEP